VLRNTQCGHVYAIAVTEHAARLYQRMAAMDQPHWAVAIERNAPAVYGDLTKGPCDQCQQRP
jgi:hypothetical protein